jgi:hypothetical protein
VQTAEEAVKALAAHLKLIMQLATPPVSKMLLGWQFAHLQLVVLLGQHSTGVDGENKAACCCIHVNGSQHMQCLAADCPLL